MGKVISMDNMEEIFQQIFRISMDEQKPEPPFEWVTCNFAPGTEFSEAYEEFWKARENLCFRFGMNEEDEDLERIMNGLMKLEEDLSRRMFYYGVKYAQMKKE